MQCSYTYNNAFYISGGKRLYRKEFLRIGEARSLVSDTVQMMALTATATRTTRQ